MRLWRIASEHRLYRADDLSGAGAAARPGRWNDANERIVYTAQTLSLCVLETVSYIGKLELPQNRYVVSIDIPDKIWKKRESLDVAALPLTWDAIPAGGATVQIGSAWLRALESALLQVPSVHVPEEFNTLINPAHPDAAGITAQVVRKYDYLKLFRSASAG